MLKKLENVFFFPGNFVLAKLGISIEDDAGISRSFINSTVWGAVVLLIAMQFI